MLITEMGGTLHLYEAMSDSSAPISGVPEVVRVDQNGLGDVVLHPGFADNNLVYISFVEGGEDDLMGAAVA